MGYNRQMFISPVNNDYICLSCEQVFRNPHTSLCGHTLCYSCWLNRVEQRSTDNVEILVCMHCREQLILSENQLQFDENTHDAIMRLIVQCGNQECSKQMPLVNRELHMEVCKHSNQYPQLCCLKPSRRTSRIIRRGGRILKTVSRRTLVKLCRTVVDRALETYTAQLNKLIDPLAENLEAIEEILCGDGGQEKPAV